MLAVYVAVWSLATISMGLANGLAAIFLVRFVLGVSQAGAYPTAASVLKRWFPYSTRGRANSTVSMGGRAGGLLAFAITPAFMLFIGEWLGWETGRWRIVFAIYGSLGLVWVVVFAWLYRDSPREHPWCNAEEVELIAPGAAAAPARPRITLPPLAMLASKEMLLMCVIGFCVDVGWVFLVSWLPQYLMETYGDYLRQTVGDCASRGRAAHRADGTGGDDWHRLGRIGDRSPGRPLRPDLGPSRAGSDGGSSRDGPVPLGSPYTQRVVVRRGDGRDFVVDRLLLGSDVGHVPGHRRPPRRLSAGPGQYVASFGSASYTWYAGSLADHNEWNTVFLLAAGAMVIATLSWLLLDPNAPGRAGRLTCRRRSGRRVISAQKRPLFGLGTDQIGDFAPVFLRFARFSTRKPP